MLFFEYQEMSKFLLDDTFPGRGNVFKTFLSCLPLPNVLINESSNSFSSIFFLAKKPIKLLINLLIGIWDQHTSLTHKVMVTWKDSIGPGPKRIMLYPFQGPQLILKKVSVVFMLLMLSIKSFLKPSQAFQEKGYFLVSGTQTFLFMPFFFSNAEGFED